MRDYSEYKTIMIAVGFPLLILGIILAIYGWISFGSGGFDAAATNQMIFMGGFIMAIVGFSLIRLAFIRPVSKYYATELSPAIRTASTAFGQGLNDAGVIGSSSQTKEIIKIKCPHCGYLDSEDAEFCSKCGKKI